MQKLQDLIFYAVIEPIGSPGLFAFLLVFFLISPLWEQDSPE